MYAVSCVTVCTYHVPFMYVMCAYRYALRFLHVTLFTCTCMLHGYGYTYRVLVHVMVWRAIHVDVDFDL